MTTLVFLFTKTTIKAWMSLNFGQIPLLTTGLAALEHLKNQFIMFSTFDHSSAFIFDWIFLILAGNEDSHKISEFEFWPDKTTDCKVSCPGGSRKIPKDL